MLSGVIVPCLTGGWAFMLRMCISQLLASADQRAGATALDPDASQSSSCQLLPNNRVSEVPGRAERCQRGAQSQKRPRGHGTPAETAL